MPFFLYQPLLFQPLTLLVVFSFFFPPPLAICFQLLTESIIGNEKTREEEEENYKDTGKKNNNVRSSLVQHNLLKADSSSFVGARDVDRRLPPRIKRPSNDDNSTFAITPTKWTL